jgi:hypothetical protein
MEGFDVVVDRLPEGNAARRTTAGLSEETPLYELINQIVGPVLSVRGEARNEIGEGWSPGEIQELPIGCNRQTSARSKGRGDLREHLLPLHPVEALARND